MVTFWERQILKFVGYFAYVLYKAKILTDRIDTLSPSDLDCQLSLIKYNCQIENVHIKQRLRPVFQYFLKTEICFYLSHEVSLVSLKCLPSVQHGVCVIAPADKFRRILIENHASKHAFSVDS